MKLPEIPNGKKIKWLGEHEFSAIYEDILKRGTDLQNENLVQGKISKFQLWEDDYQCQDITLKQFINLRRFGDVSESSLRYYIDLSNRNARKFFPGIVIKKFEHYDSLYDIDPFDEYIDEPAYREKPKDKNDYYIFYINFHGAKVQFVQSSISESERIYCFTSLHRLEYLKKEGYTYDKNFLMTTPSVNRGLSKYDFSNKSLIIVNQMKKSYFICDSIHSAPIVLNEDLVHPKHSPYWLLDEKLVRAFYNGDLDAKYFRENNNRYEHSYSIKYTLEHDGFIKLLEAETGNKFKNSIPKK